MALTLKTVPAGHGSRWIGDAFRLFGRRPLAFTAMAFVFSGAAILAQLLPLLGTLLPLMALPLLTLGFMVAGQSALLDGPVHPRQFIEPLRTDPVRRRALIKLCVSYGVAMVLVLLLADLLSDHAWVRFQALAAKGGEMPTGELETLMPNLVTALLVMGGLGTLVSVPYWHAPALVHWGGQGARHALFSSTLAVWRNKGAFFVYMAGWFGLLLLFGVLSSVLLQVLGLQDWAGGLVTPAVLVLSAVFYISVLFTFNDSFGGPPTPAGDEPLPPPA
jgi:hypothetical protein